jgi:hypothetical protein
MAVSSLLLQASAPWLNRIDWENVTSTYLRSVHVGVALGKVRATSIDVHCCVASCHPLCRVVRFPFLQSTCSVQGNAHTIGEHTEVLLTCGTDLAGGSSMIIRWWNLPVPVFPYGLHGINAGTGCSSESTGRKTSPYSVTSSRILMETSFSQIRSTGIGRVPGSFCQPFLKTLFSRPNCIHMFCIVWQASTNAISTSPYLVAILTRDYRLLFVKHLCKRPKG